MPISHVSPMTTFEGGDVGTDQYNRIKNFAALLRSVNKSASYSPLLEDSGAVFNTAGATGPVTFTLPAVAGNAGLFYIFSNQVGQNMVITAPAGTLVFTNNAAATNATFSTAGQLIGASLMVVCDGTKWQAYNLNGACAVTLS